MLVEASRTLAAALARSDGTPAGRKAHVDARQVQDALAARVPTVKVRVTGAPAGKVRLLVDGIGTDASDEIAINPGDHTVGASADGFVDVEREVKLAEGAREQVTLELVAVHPVAAPVVAAEKKRTGSRVPGAIVTTLGGAGLVVGGIFGGLALSKSDAARSQCNGDVCSPASAGAIATSKTFGNVSTGAFIAGGALAVTGIVLLIVPPGGGNKSDDAGESALAVPRVSPWIGPGAAGLGATGRF
jgi:hypothetical protein